MAQSHLIQTIPEKCRVCYTCIRECPAKAIRVSNGQAEIISDRCIECGNCVVVCSQKAKEVRSSIELVDQLLKNREKYKVVACIAPSFPAEFPDIDPEKVVTAIKILGFDAVVEVAFGADLVAKETKEKMEENPDKRYIASSCPAIVSYIEKYHPSLTKYILPVVSPMIATAKVIKHIYGNDTKVVFIGPCIAKKYEAEREEYSGLVKAVLTYYEMQKIFERSEIDLQSLKPTRFDPPMGSKGWLFPVARGLLEAGDIEDNLMSSDVISTEGPERFLEVMKDFENGRFDELKLLDSLCCEGCIMGAGMTIDSSQPARHAQIRQFARKRYLSGYWEDWEENMASYEYLDLSCKFSSNDMRLPIPSKKELQSIFEKMGKCGPHDELNCGACGYDTCLEHAMAIHTGLAESEMCLPYTIEQLKKTACELSKSYEDLADTKQALAQNEKLASMGQLAAGIAHEVNNPLGVVLLYSHLLLEQCPEDNPQMKEDLQLVVDQADRCKKIVGGLLNFARKNKALFKNTNVSSLIDHAVKMIVNPNNISINVSHCSGAVKADIDSDQFTQVITNLVTNAIEAMINGGEITVETDQDRLNLIVRIIDTGPGIAKENIKKIFEPFFTTKQMGKGTGLGLAVSYGIIKMHKGQIFVESNTDAQKGAVGTTFTIKVPKKNETTEY